MIKKDKNTEFVGAYTTAESTLKLQDKKIVAFIGRSNAGKSSLINTIFNKTIAKSSQTPGKTQSINFFVFNSKIHIVDLPGYGYAKESKTSRKQWIKETTEFLLEHKKVKLLVLVVDIRRGLEIKDKEFLDWMHNHCSFPCCIALTKTDKIKNNEIKSTLEKTKKEAPVSCIDVFLSTNTSSQSGQKIKNTIETILKSK